jgi:hypothetical protein
MTTISREIFAVPKDNFSPEVLSYISVTHAPSGSFSAKRSNLSCNVQMTTSRKVSSLNKFSYLVYPAILSALQADM